MKNALISFAVKVVQINHWGMIITNEVDVMIGVVYYALNIGSSYCKVKTKNRVTKKYFPLERNAH
jgi:hypothetical protein